MISTTGPWVMCTVPAHVTSGSALIDAWPTPIMSTHCSVYLSMWMSVSAHPPLAHQSISDPFESEMACEYQLVTLAILTVYELPLECTRQSLLVTLIDHVLLAVLCDEDIIELSILLSEVGLISIGIWCTELEAYVGKVSVTE